MGNHHTALFEHVKRQPTDASVHQLFAKYDRDASGELAGEQVDRFLSDLFDFVFEHDFDFPLAKKDITKEWLAHFDKNNDHKLDKKEFHLLLKRILL